MLAEERKRKICEKVQVNGAVKLAELVKEFGVSTETVRRDLLELERKGNLQRTHGGAVSVAKMVVGQDLSQRRDQFREQKRQIAEMAMEQIQEGDTIALDSGSTALEFAEEIARRFQKLTVVTHSLEVFERLSHQEGIQTILCGGYYLETERAFWGELTRGMLQVLRVSKAFLFPSAISLHGGIMDYNYELVAIQKEYLKIADRIIFSADSSKFEKNAFLKLCDLSQEYTLLTDSGLPDAILELYQQNDVPIFRAEQPNDSKKE